MQEEVGSADSSNKLKDSITYKNRIESAKRSSHHSFSSEKKMLSLKKGRSKINSIKSAKAKTSYNHEDSFNLNESII